MKALILLVASLLSITAYAAQIPYSPELEARLSEIPHMVKATLDVTGNAALGSSTVNSGAHGLGVYIPGGAEITRSFLDVKTAFTDTGSGTIAIHCEDANNIKSAADFTGLSVGYNAGATPAGFIANRCEITATVAGVDSEGGKADIYVEYILR